MRRQLQRAPGSAEGWNALGFVLKLQGRFPEALACHEKAVTLKPDFVEGWTHYGLTLGLLGRNHDALARYERALEIRPSYPGAMAGRAEALHKVYRMDEAIAEYDALLKLEPRNLEARSYRLFALENSDTLTRDELFAEHKAYGALVGSGMALPDYDYSSQRRIRVAILSPDFRTHSCAYFIEPLLEKLPKDEFELFLYHDHFQEDEVSARLKALAHTWRNFVGQPHASVEQAIRADRPDVLIDLSGHIGHTIRLPLFARRLAPVQITYLGYPDTTGVPAMDFRFTDPIADPPGDADRFATEKLVRFSSVAWCYRAPAQAPDVPIPDGSTDRPVAFGCFNSPTKYTNSLLLTWGRLLACVPNSTLVLKARDFGETAVRAPMMEWMGRCGIPAERVELLPRVAGTAEHLQQYARVDVALDTFPYNGTTTTCEALWMGRPVVTVRGTRHAARVSTSLLSAVGRQDWVAESPEDYVRIAAELARAPGVRMNFAASARAELARSPLMDAASQGDRFAAALRQCWISRCCEQPRAGAEAATA
jgi:predicted O-linked N-acetylglucosamine transferase (SPINDLY family)